MKPASMTPIIPVKNESRLQSAHRRLRTRQLRRLRPDASVSRVPPPLPANMVR